MISQHCIPIVDNSFHIQTLIVFPVPADIEYEEIHKQLSLVHLSRREPSFSTATKLIKMRPDHNSLRIINGTRRTPSNSDSGLNTGSFKR